MSELSSVHKKIISNKQAVPVFQHDLFRDSLESKFATVNLGHGLYPNGVDPTLFKGYLRLRKNVYVDQTEMLDSSVVLPDGIEIDDDDGRSEHFMVAENIGLGEIAIVACLRAIVKYDKEKLPIEEFFPEEFSQSSACEAGPIAEISRFISKANSLTDSLRSIASLFNTALAYVDRSGIDSVYAVVEEPLEKILSKFGAPSVRMASPKMVREYNDVNLGVKINTDAMKQKIGRTALDAVVLDPGSVNFWGSKTYV